MGRIAYKKKTCGFGATEMQVLKDMHGMIRGNKILFLKGARFSRMDSQTPRVPLKGFTADRIIFDDCCLDSNPCDRCKKIMEKQNSD